MLALHVLVAAFAPLADALASASERDPFVHIESEAGANCPPAHDDQLCQTCRLMESRFTPSACRHRDILQTFVREVEPVSRDSKASHSYLGLPLGPRAPPLV
jgi:hypothetical protein